MGTYLVCCGVASASQTVFHLCVLRLAGADVHHPHVYVIAPEGPCETYKKHSIPANETLLGRRRNGTDPRVPVSHAGRPPRRCEPDDEWRQSGHCGVC